MNHPLLPYALSQCATYCSKKMWEHAWNVLEDLPPGLKDELIVQEWQTKIQAGMKENGQAPATGPSSEAA